MLVTDGTSISFATPISQMNMDNYVWDFSITKGGQVCVAFEELGADGSGGFSLRTAAGEVREELQGMNVVITCQNGAKVSIGAIESLKCIDAGLPGIAWSSGTSTSVSFSFVGGAQSRSLFYCGS